jgi:hypothetical protein
MVSLMWRFYSVFIFSVCCYTQHSLEPLVGVERENMKSKHFECLFLYINLFSVHDTFRVERYYFILCYVKQYERVFICTDAHCCSKNLF